MEVCVGRAVREYRRLGPPEDVVEALDAWKSSAEAHSKFVVGINTLDKNWPPSGAYIEKVCRALVDESGEEVSDELMTKLAECLSNDDVNDVREAHATFDHGITVRMFERRNEVGLRLWPAAELVTAFVAAAPEFWSGSVVEVGAGVGLVGLTLAKLAGCRVCLTDGDPAVVRNLEYNVEINNLSHICDVQMFEWSSDSELPRKSPNSIVAADAVYDPIQTIALARVLHDLAVTSPGPCDIWLANEIRDDRTWTTCQAALHGAGLRLEEDASLRAVRTIDSNPHDLLNPRTWYRLRSLCLNGGLRLLRFALVD